MVEARKARLVLRGLVLAMTLALTVSGWAEVMLPATASAPGSLKSTTGPTNVPSDIRHDVTWSLAGSPYLVSSSVYVRDGATLTIDPGVVVKFAPTGGAVDTGGIRVVAGRLIARGTGALPIVFTSLHDDTVGGDSDGNAGVLPEPGDWATISIGGEDAESAVETSPSVISNASIRYGGEGGLSNCPHGAAVSVSDLGRLRLSKTEIVYAYAAGVAVGALDSGIGFASVSNVRVSASGCGFFPRAGTFTNNVVDYSVPRAFWANQPTGVTMSGNWFVNGGDALGSQAPTPQTFDFRNNAIMGGMASMPRSQVPVDLSYNWWGPNPTMLGDCSVSGEKAVPATILRAAVLGGKCWPTPVHDSYFTDVLPFSEPPPFPQTGPGANPSAPAPVPWEQMLGGLGGSEYAYPAKGSMGDPIATATGSYVEEAIDVAIPTAGMGLAASRVYNSADPAVGWLGKGWHFGYEAWLDVSGGGAVVVLHAEDGQQVRYDRQVDGSYRGGPGVTARLASDGTGWLVTTRGQLERRFGSEGRLRRVSDANGNHLWLTYAESGALDSVIGSGRLLTFESNPEGRITRVNLSDGRWVGYGYTDGLLTSVRDLAGRTTMYGYDAEGRLTSKTNAAGHVVMRLVYDPVTGRVSDQWDALDNHSQFEWNAATGVATMTDPRGQVWTDQYEDNLLMSRTTPDGATTTYTYDADLQVILTEGSRGWFNELSYNSAGDLVATSTPTGTVRTVYDQRHRPVESINARGTRVEYRYDAADNVSKMIRPEPGNPGGTLETSFTYSNRGLLLSATDARGKTTTHTYTGPGDLASTTTPGGSKTTFTYDGSGRMTSRVDPRGNEPAADPAHYTTRYEYTDGDQLHKVIDPLGRTVTQTYDQVGRLKTVLDPKGRATTYSYDHAGHVTRVQGPDSTTEPTAFDYDANGNLIQQTDTAGRAVAYEYDAMNRIAKATTPLGVYTYAHDRAGNLIKITNPTAKTTSMSYDAANRLLKIDYPADGGADVTYRYDANGNRTKMIDGAGTVTYAFDKLDRPTTVTRGSSTFRYGYNQVGSLTKVTHPDGTVFEYAYDDDHRLDTVHQAGALLADYAYDAAGLPTTLTRGNNTTATYTHDRAGQLTRVLDVAPNAPPTVERVLLDETYAYDQVGNLTGITGPGGGRVFAYDNLDRLIAACYDTTTCESADDFVRWAYDDAGNRTSETRPGSTTTYTYHPANGLLTGTSGPEGETGFTYDGLGRLKTRSPSTSPTVTYTYDAVGRLTSETTAGSPPSNHTYDGDGRRLSSTHSGATTAFGWDPLSYQLATESDASGVIRRYAYGIGPLGVDRPGQSGRDYYHLDRMASVRAVTNQSATPQWTSEWEPYGRTRTVTKVDPSASLNPIGWTGQYADPAGQVHLRARQYDPALGRFTAPDPAAAMSYSATGVYANSNPLTYNDPTGLWPQWLGTAAAGVGIVAAVGAGVVTAPVAVGVLGGVAVVAGAVTAVDSIHSAYQVCTGAEKGFCAGEVALAFAGVATGGIGANAIRVGRAARVAAKSVDNISTVLMRTSLQLQKKFKHAVDFGVTGGYSKANASKFSAAMHQHMNAAGTRGIVGTYRNAPGRHYLDPNNGLNVVSDLDGNFITGFRLGSGQLNDVLTTGRLW